MVGLAQILDYNSQCPRVTVPNLFGTKDQFCERQFFHGLGGWGTVSVSLACPLLTFNCVTQFLTGHGLVPVCVPVVGDPLPGVSHPGRGSWTS